MWVRWHEERLSLANDVVELLKQLLFVHALFHNHENGVVAGNGAEDAVNVGVVYVIGYRARIAWAGLYNRHVA